MDKLTREAHDHGKILESMVFFEKFLKTITSNESEDYTVRLHQFSDEYIVEHFRFEEEEIFPVILRKGTPEERAFIEELQDDHQQILASLEEFKGTVSLYEPQPSREQVRKIINASEAVISEILVHARKEDERLFPALKKYKV